MVAATQTLTQEAPSSELKRLSFVQQTANTVTSAHGLVEKVYKGARAYTPAAVEPMVSRVEDTIAAYTAPAVAAAQDAGEKILHVADSKVDYVMSTATNVTAQAKGQVASSLDSVRDLGKSNRAVYQAAYENAYTTYLDAILKVSNKIADTLSPTKNVQRGRDQLHAAIATAKQLSDPDAAVEMVHSAWLKFTSIPTVSKVLDTVEPVTNLGLQTFYAAHDKVVANGLYKKGVDTGLSTFGYLQTTTPYKLSKTYLYPLVRPVADPALDKFNGSKVIGNVLSYWTPVPTTPSVTVATSQTKVIANLAAPQLSTVTAA